MDYVTLLQPLKEETRAAWFNLAMKIQTYGINPADSQKAPTKNEKTAVERPFSDYLSDVLVDQKGAVNPKSQVSSMELASSTTTLSDTQTNALMLGEDVLGVLDHLSLLLNNPGTNDHALNPLADTLSKQIDDIKAARDSLAPDDPLRSTLNTIGAVSAV